MLFTPKCCNYKKYAKKIIRDAVLYEKINYNLSSIGTTWDLFKNECIGKDIVIVLSEDDINSYYVFDNFYKKILKFCNYIKEVVELTDDRIDKEIRGYSVGNKIKLSEIDKSSIILLISLDNYEKDIGYLHKIGYGKIFDFYTMECSEKSCIYKRFWESVSALIPSPVVEQYIDRNIKHRTNDTWNEFNKQIKGKKLFVFGCGNGFQDFYFNYKRKYTISGILDNASSKWGGYIHGICINSPEILSDYDPRDVVVLITTIYFEGILIQLEKQGICNCYVYTQMESQKNIYWFKKLQKRWMINKEVLYFYLYRLFSIRKNKITVMRHYGKGYGCHNKYIVEELLREGYEGEIVWLVNDVYERMPSRVKKVENTIKNRAYHLSTANIWLDNDVKSMNARKRKNQIYINTWHGTGISLKKFYLDDKQRVNPSMVKRVLNDTSMADVYLAGSTYIAKIYESAFKYRGCSKITGSPRVDILINGNQDVDMTVRKRLGISSDEKMLLYAPTMRIDAGGAFLEQKNLFHIDLMRIKKVLAEKWSGEWVIAVRLHPMMPKISSSVWSTQGILDLTSYQDVQELLLISDVLLTDYSSIMFDMGYAGKKVFLYTEDEVEYMRQKDLYFPISKLPFPTARSQEELENIIREFDEKKYCYSVECFNNSFGVLEDGRASQRVAKLITQLSNRKHHDN